jgi:hypothetical protein
VLRSRVFRVVVMAAVVALSLSMAIPVGAASRDVCSGTLAKPGVLVGTYSSNVTVRGACQVSAGAADVQGNLTLASGATVVSAFAHAGSRLTVEGNVIVGSGAVLVVGCEPNFSSCLDNPNGTSRGHVFGNLVATDALGVLVHASTIDGNVVQRGGGGGLSCAPPSSGYFGVSHSPVFSDYEDNTVHGNVVVRGLRSCWFGALRDTVDGNVVVRDNSFGDADANEVISNRVAGNAVCSGNSPQVQFGDSMGTPNRVGGAAVGECGFHTLKHNPEPNGPLTPISVHKT